LTLSQISIGRAVDQTTTGNVANVGAQALACSGRVAASSRIRLSTQAA